MRRIMTTFAAGKAVLCRQKNKSATPLTMTPTVDFIRSQFVAFNARYFGGSLPEPRFVVTHARTILGQFVCSQRRGWGVFAGRPRSFTIKVSAYFDMPEREYQNVLLHEMIHYHIAYNRIKDTSPHGEKFRAMMRRLNEEEGWNIRVSGEVAQYGVADEAAERRVRAVVAMGTADGKHYLSVVQRGYVGKVEAAIRRTAAITTHEWFVTTDNYFRDFPQVRSLRARRMAEGVFMAALEKLRKEGRKLS